MGLLDDAIREHLELKRRRGADPAEVARAEQEALGPVRRDREPAPPEPEDYRDEAAVGDAPAPAEHDEQTGILFPDDHEAGPIRADALGDEPPLPPLPGSVPGTTAGDPATAPALPADGMRERDLADVHEDAVRPRRDRDDDEPEPPHGGQAPPASAAPAHSDAPAREDDDARDRDRDILDQPTTEYRIEDLDDEDEDDQPGGSTPPNGHAQRSDDDVLGATPDFLQETPEHDRLWFEQRPPRDFDFDD